MIYDFSSFKLSDDDFEKLSEGSQGIIKQFKILKSGSKIFMDIKKEIEDNYEDREISDEIGCIKLPKKK
ncbi:MAG: hypothetical protein N4Q32_00320 [Neisseriaceae bacterium]|nr:hypothetical protein [Neisseriaceae bacterium]